MAGTLRTSTPGMDAASAMETWRPSGDRMTFGDAWWLGAAWGLAIHATIHFFSVPLPGLRGLLVVFAPAERFAASLSAGSAPLAHWALLLVTQAVFWGLVAVAALAAWREVEAFVRERRTA